MPEDLKINVGVGGAKEAEAALKGVAGAEASIGHAATAGAAGIKKTADAKTKASEASKELHMRDATLLRQLAMLGPEFAIAADAVNQLVTKTTSAGLALGLLGTAIGVVAYAYSKYSAVQAKDKEQAAQLLTSLNQQYDAYLKMAEAIERAARAKGALGAGTGEALAARFQTLRPAGVSQATVKRAAELAATLGRVVTDEEAVGAMSALELEEEPKRKTEKGIARAVYGGALRPELPGRLATFRGKSPAAVRAAETAGAKALLGLKPQARSEAIIEEIIAKETEAGRPLDRAQLEEILGLGVEHPLWRYLGAGEPKEVTKARTGRARDLVERYDAGGILLSEARGGRRFSRTGEEGTPIIQFFGPVNQGGVMYNDRGADPAGQIQRSPRK